MKTTGSNRQVAALAIRVAKSGEIYVLLVTSRETKRWVIPKGWPSKKLSDWKAAAREARQEAGVTGKTERRPIGTYSYRKVLPEGSRMIDVAVYALWVKKELNRWPEQRQRKRIWTSFEEASKMVREVGLQRLFLSLAEEVEGLRSVSPQEK